MRFFERLRAIFNYKGQRAEMQLKSAEIRGDKIFLHPVNDPDHTFCVSGKAIDILIDPAVALTEDDFRVIENEKINKLQEQLEINPTAPLEKLLHPQTPPDEKQPPKTKKVPATNEPPKSAVEVDPETKSTKKADEENAHEQTTPCTEKQSQTQDIVSKSPQSYARFMPKMRTITMRLYQEEYDLIMEAIEAKGYKKNEYLLACALSSKKKSMEATYKKYYNDHQQRRKADREAAKRALEKAERQEIAG